MIKTVTLKTLDEILSLLKEQEYSADMNRYRSPYYYRGMPDMSFRLETSLRRSCKNKSRELEPGLLRSFTKYAVIDDPEVADSVWRQLIVGRHHGLPTRLMDWSHSQLIALHFSTSGEPTENMDRHDGVIWRIDSRELYARLPEKYRSVLDEAGSSVYTIDLLKKAVDSLEEYDTDMGSGSMVLIEPPSVDLRIVNQYGNFLIVPSGITDVEDFFDKHTSGTIKYIIDKDIRWRVRDMLDQLNVNERLVYPGLDGLSMALSRYYYVKED